MQQHYAGLLVIEASKQHMGRSIKSLVLMTMSDLQMMNSQAVTLGSLPLQPSLGCCTQCTAFACLTADGQRGQCSLPSVHFKTALTHQEAF